MTEFTFSIKAEKEILVFKIDCPISRISEEIKDVIISSRNKIAYEVNNTITVHTNKVTDVGMFIDKALNLGATNIGNIEFKLEDQNSYCNELLSVATQKAKAKADVVAKASGQKITGIKELRTSCSVNSTNYYPRLMNAKVMYAGSAADAAVESSSTQVQGGSMKLYATVNAEFYAK